MEMQTLLLVFSNRFPGESLPSQPDGRDSPEKRFARAPNLSSIVTIHNYAGCSELLGIIDLLMQRCSLRLLWISQFQAKALRTEFLSLIGVQF